MGIPCACTACGSKFVAPEAAQGRTLKCPRCQAPITVVKSAAAQRPSPAALPKAVEAAKASPAGFASLAGRKPIVLVGSLALVLAVVAVLSLMRQGGGEAGNRSEPSSPKAAPGGDPPPPPVARAEPAPGAAQPSPGPAKPVEPLQSAPAAAAMAADESDDSDPAKDDAPQSASKTKHKKSKSSSKKAPKAPFSDWLQDFAKAQTEAAKQDKDILLLFGGSDWEGKCADMARDVFLQSSFRSSAASKYVLVYVDFPKKKEHRSRVEDATRNRRLAQSLLVNDYPTIFVADSAGRIFARLGYVSGGPSTFLNKLNGMRGTREALQLAVKQTQSDRPAGVVDGLGKGIKLLEEMDLVPYNGRLLADWLALARKLDDDNRQGIHERVFGNAWMGRVATVQPPDVMEHRRQLQELEAWGAAHAFKESDRAATMYLVAAVALLRTQDAKNAGRAIEAGLKCHPKNSKILGALTVMQMAARGGMGSGTGFVVAADGHLLTNRHVVEGAPRLVVQLPDRKEPVPAEVVDTDTQYDIALLKIDPPQGVRLQALPIATTRLRRGLKIGTFGYPLGGAVGGSGIKLTTGIVSAPAEETAEGMILLDCRVNPGNSGGPLCDTQGNVVGMVTAKSFSSTSIDSYGMALPAGPLCDFLKDHLPKFLPKTATAAGRSLEWDLIDRRVSRSVLMVLRMAAAPASAKPAERTSRPSPSAAAARRPAAPPVTGRLYLLAKGDFQLYHKGRRVAFTEGVSPDVELAEGDIIAVRMYSASSHRSFRLAFVAADRHKVLPFQAAHFSETEDKLPESVAASDIKGPGQPGVKRSSSDLVPRWSGLNLPGEAPPWLWGEHKEQWYQYGCVIDRDMFQDVP